MKRTIAAIRFGAILLLLSFSSLLASAQENDRAKTLTDKMKTELTLTDEQYNKVLPVNETFVKSLADLKSGGGGKLAKLKKLRSLDSERDKSLKSILTKEQYNLYQEQKKEKREKARESYRDKP